MPSLALRRTRIVQGIILVVSLYFTFYNWTRIHKTLRVTPAMASGLTDHLWTMEEIVALMDEAAPKPGRPKTYRKRAA